MLVQESSRKPSPKGEHTGQQTISYSFGDGLLYRDYTNMGTYKQLRAVRKDPTVQLARSVFISCIQAGSWCIEVDEGVSDEVKRFMEHILCLREDFLFNTIAYGKIDFGWCGFEKIFKVENDKIMVEALKPLLHDMTHVMITPKGRFNGYRQAAFGVGAGYSLLEGTLGPVYPVDLPVTKCMHVAFDTEAGNYYGIPLLENIRAAMDMWDECNDGARRYDLKLAGSHWVIKYPPGTGSLDGVSTDNGEIAALLLAALESSGNICIPTTTAQVLQELTNAEVADLYAWHVELLSDKSPRQESFGKRLSYLDTLKVRGLLMPERSLMEGTHGTKAEAGEHIGLMMNNMEQVDRTISRMVNTQVINQLVMLNYGAEMVGKVRLVSTPLVDKQIAYIRDLYKEKLQDPDIDVAALRDKLDIPTLEGGSVMDNPGNDKDDIKDEEDR